MRPIATTWVEVGWRSSRSLDVGVDADADYMVCWGGVDGVGTAVVGSGLALEAAQRRTADMTFAAGAGAADIHPVTCTAAGTAAGTADTAHTDFPQTACTNSVVGTSSADSGTSSPHVAADQ